MTPLAATHSPGPWSLGPTEGIGQVGRLRIVDASGVQVADCEAPRRADKPLAFVRSYSEDTANAHLLSAAPELLESARIDQALQMRGYTVATARALGEDAHDAYLSAGPGGLRNWARCKREVAIAKAEGR